ncbi:unnamed protein product [Cyclocybe aegerita]|uniref:Uncharacterized protein n=1 Tax=Cyclocybe aegerita TaxID=1973307 RepID=A0A8S0VUZ0_CYCAE|nr:unnamed protein product [Cyclocybe aegerita]
MTLHEVQEHEAETEGDHEEEILEQPGAGQNPYPELMKDTSFTRCLLVTRAGEHTDSFSRCLLPLGHGFPLYSPVGNLTSRPQEHIKQGVSVGDVGLIDERGQFTYFFNVFLPTTHPRQGEVLPDFVPMPPLDRSVDLREESQYHPPGTVLVSKGVLTSYLSKSPMYIEFKIKAREGAVWIFPHGASREDLISTTRLHEYIKTHALTWYRHINTGLSQLYPNASLYVVTGCDKTNSWANLSSLVPVTVRYDGRKRAYWDANVEYVTSSINRDPNKYTDNCAVFIRGIRVAVNPTLWTKHLLGSRPPEQLAYCSILATPILGIRARIRTWQEDRKGRLPAAIPGQEPRPYHPLEFAAQLVLNDSPEAAIAIVDDYMWAAVADGEEGTYFRMVDQLIRLLEAFDVVLENDIATLKRKEPEPRHTAILAWLRSLLILALGVKRRARNAARAKVGQVLPGPGPRL